MATGLLTGRSSSSVRWAGAAAATSWRTPTRRGRHGDDRGRDVDFLDDLAAQLGTAVPAAYAGATSPSPTTAVADGDGEDAFGAVDGIVCNRHVGAFGVTLEDADFDDGAGLQGQPWDRCGSRRRPSPPCGDETADRYVFVGSQIVRRVFAGRISTPVPRRRCYRRPGAGNGESGPYNMRVNAVDTGRGGCAAPERHGPSAGGDRRGMTVEEQLPRMLNDVLVADLATNEVLTVRPVPIETSRRPDRSSVDATRETFH